MKITLLCSITRADPVFDDDGEHVEAVTKWFGREQKIKLHENTFCPAFTVIDVEKKEADELIARGYAREFNAQTDDGLPGASDEESSEETIDASTDADAASKQVRGGGGLKPTGNRKGRSTQALD